MRFWPHCISSLLCSSLHTAPLTSETSRTLYSRRWRCSPCSSSRPPSWVTCSSSSLSKCFWKGKSTRRWSSLPKRSGRLRSLPASFLSSHLPSDVSGLYTPVRRPVFVYGDNDRPQTAVCRAQGWGGRTLYKLQAGGKDCLYRATSGQVLCVKKGSRNKKLAPGKEIEFNKIRKSVGLVFLWADLKK